MRSRTVLSNCKLALVTVFEHANLFYARKKSSSRNSWHSNLENRVFSAKSERFIFVSPVRDAVQGTAYGGSICPNSCVFRSIRLCPIGSVREIEVERPTGNDREDRDDVPFISAALHTDFYRDCGGFNPRMRRECRSRRAPDRCFRFDRDNSAPLAALTKNSRRSGNAVRLLLNVLLRWSEDVSRILDQAQRKRDLVF